MKGAVDNSIKDQPMAVLPLRGQSASCLTPSEVVAFSTARATRAISLATATVATFARVGTKKRCVG